MEILLYNYLYTLRRPIHVSLISGMEEVSWQANEAPVREVCWAKGKLNTTTLLKHDMRLSYQFESEQKGEAERIRRLRQRDVGQLRGRHLWGGYGYDIQVWSLRDKWINLKITQTHLLAFSYLHYRELEPMYKALHAYVRRNLRRLYGDEHISKTGEENAQICLLRTYF